jgi:hypothetical protein
MFPFQMRAPGQGSVAMVSVGFCDDSFNGAVLLDADVNWRRTAELNEYRSTEKKHNWLPSTKHFSAIVLVMPVRQEAYS